MADLVYTNTLQNGTTADADKVMQNFNNAKTYINASTIRTDGATSMAAPLSLYGDPSAADHAVRKSYVDGVYVWAQGSTAQSFTFDTQQVVKFSSKVYDYVNGAGDTSSSNYNLSTGKFTAPRAGVYQVSWALQTWPYGNWDTLYRMYIRSANGLFTLRGPMFVPSKIANLAAERVTMSMSASVFCSQGAMLWPELAINQPGTGDYEFGQFLTIAWLHA